MLEQVQIGDIPVPPIVDDTVEEEVTERIQEQIGLEPMEEQVGDVPVPQIVDDTVEVVIGYVQVIAAAGSVGVSTAPVHGQARRDSFVAQETTQNSVEIPTVHESMTDETLRKLETIRFCCADGEIVADVEHVALMAQIRVTPLRGSGVGSSLCLGSWRMQALGRTTSIMMNSSEHRR